MSNESPATPPSLIDRMLSERVLYPVAGALMVLALVAVALRPRHYGPATDFELPLIGPQGDLGSERLRLQSLRGHPVLIDFWATWCGPCRAEIPILERVYERYRGRGLQVIGVNVDESGPSLVPRFREHFNIQYPLVYDLGGTASRIYRVEGLPTLVLVDRDGAVRMRLAGTLGEEDLVRLIEPTL